MAGRLPGKLPDGQYDEDDDRDGNGWDEEASDHTPAQHRAPARRHGDNGGWGRAGHVQTGHVCPLHSIIVQEGARDDHTIVCIADVGQVDSGLYCFKSLRVAGDTHHGDEVGDDVFIG